MGALTLWIIVAAFTNDSPSVAHLHGWWLFFLALAIILDLPAHARTR